MPAIETSTVLVPRAHDAETMESFYARPEGDAPRPGVVVIHEISGLNDNIRALASRFAGEGYAALAVNLFANRSRVLCMLQAFYGIMLRPLDNPMLDDLNATLAFLRKQDNVDPQRIGVVGFCFAGAYALQLAVTDKGMKAASVFYGANPRPLDVVAQACPIVGSYPDKDFTTPAARALEAALTQYNVPHDIKIYDQTAHSFFGRQRTPAEKEAAEDAWKRMLTFFGEHLK